MDLSTPLTSQRTWRWNRLRDTPEIHAVRAGRYAALIIMLNTPRFESLPRINTPNTLKETPLTVAVSMGNENMVSLLTQKGANVNMISKNGQLPFFFSVNPAVSKRLISLMSFHSLISTQGVRAFAHHLLIKYSSKLLKRTVILAFLKRLAGRAIDFIKRAVATMKSLSTPAYIKAQIMACITIPDLRAVALVALDGAFKARSDEKDASLPAAPLKPFRMYSIDRKLASSSAFVESEPLGDIFVGMEPAHVSAGERDEVLSALEAAVTASASKVAGGIWLNVKADIVDTQNKQQEAWQKYLRDDRNLRQVNSLSPMTPRTVEFCIRPQGITYLKTIAPKLALTAGYDSTNKVHNLQNSYIKSATVLGATSYSFLCLGIEFEVGKFSINSGSVVLDTKAEPKKHAFPDAKKIAQLKSKGTKSKTFAAPPGKQIVGFQVVNSPGSEAWLTARYEKIIETTFSVGKNHGMLVVPPSAVRGVDATIERKKRVIAQKFEWPIKYSFFQQLVACCSSDANPKNKKEQFESEDMASSRNEGKLERDGYEGRGAHSALYAIERTMRKVHWIEYKQNSRNVGDAKNISIRRVLDGCLGSVRAAVMGERLDVGAPRAAGDTLAMALALAIEFHFRTNDLFTIASRIYQAIFSEQFAKQVQRRPIPVPKCSQLLGRFAGSNLERFPDPFRPDAKGARGITRLDFLKTHHPAVPKECVVSRGSGKPHVEAMAEALKALKGFMPFSGVTNPSLRFSPDALALSRAAFAAILTESMQTIIESKGAKPSSAMMVIVSESAQILRMLITFCATFPKTWGSDAQESKSYAQLISILEKNLNSTLFHDWAAFHIAALYKTLRLDLGPNGKPASDRKNISVNKTPSLKKYLHMEYEMSKINSNISQYLVDLASIELERFIPLMLESAIEGSDGENDALILDIVQLARMDRGDSLMRINGRRLTSLSGTPTAFAYEAAVRSGRWYFEVKVLRATSEVRIGWVKELRALNPSQALTIEDVEVNVERKRRTGDAQGQAAAGLGSDGYGYGFTHRGGLWHSGKMVGTDSNSKRLANGDVLGCELVFSTKGVEMALTINGKAVSRHAFKTGDDFTRLSPAVSVASRGQVEVCFDSKSLKYAKREATLFTDMYSRSKSASARIELADSDNISKLAGDYYKRAIDQVGKYSIAQIRAEFERGPRPAGDVSIDMQFLSVFLACLTSKTALIAANCAALGLEEPSPTQGKAIDILASYTDALFSRVGAALVAAADLKGRDQELKSATRAKAYIERVSVFFSEQPIFKAARGLTLALTRIVDVKLCGIALRLLPSLVDFVKSLNYFMRTVPIAPKISPTPVSRFANTVMSVLSTLFSTLICTAKPGTIEKKNAYWLQSGLFNGGLHIPAKPDAKDSKALAHPAWIKCAKLSERFYALRERAITLGAFDTHSENGPPPDWRTGFLGDVIEDRGDAKKFMKKIQRKRKMLRVLNQHGGKTIKPAVRAVFAALLKHSRVLRSAEKAAKAGAKAPIPPKVMTLWEQAFRAARTGRALRNKEPEAIERYGSLEAYASGVINKCQFLITVNDSNRGVAEHENTDNVELWTRLLLPSEVSSLKIAEGDGGYGDEDNPDGSQLASSDSKLTSSVRSSSTTAEFRAPSLSRGGSSLGKKLWAKARGMIKLILAQKVAKRFAEMLTLRRRLDKHQQNSSERVSFYTWKFIETKSTDIDAQIIECLIIQQIRSTYRIAGMKALRDLAESLCATKKSPHVCPQLQELFAVEFASLVQPKAAKKSIEDTDSKSRFKIGDLVALQGLRMAGHLNGRRGHIRGPMLSTGRYPVLGPFLSKSINAMAVKNFLPGNLKLIQRNQDSAEDMNSDTASHYMDNIECCGARDSENIAAMYYSTLALLLYNVKSMSSLFLLQVNAAVNVEFRPADFRGLCKSGVVQHIRKYLPFWDVENESIDEQSLDVSVYSSAWNTFRIIAYNAFSPHLELGESGRAKNTESGKTKQGGSDQKQSTGDAVGEKTASSSVEQASAQRLSSSLHEVRDSVMQTLYTLLQTVYNSTGLFRPASVFAHGGGAEEKLFDMKLADPTALVESSNVSLSHADVSWLRWKAAGGTEGADGNPSLGNLCMANQVLWVLLRCTRSAEGCAELSQRGWVALLSRAFYMPADILQGDADTTNAAAFMQILTMRIIRKIMRSAPVGPRPPCAGPFAESDQAEEKYHSFQGTSEDMVALFHRVGLFTLPLPFSSYGGESKGTSGQPKSWTTAIAASLGSWTNITARRQIHDLMFDLNTRSTVVEDITYMFRALLTHLNIFIDKEIGVHTTRVSVSVFAGESVWSLKERVASLLNCDPGCVTLRFKSRNMGTGVLSDYRVCDGAVIRAIEEDTKANREQRCAQAPVEKTWGIFVSGLVLDGLEAISPSIVELNEIAALQKKGSREDRTRAQKLQWNLEKAYAALAVLGGNVTTVREGGRVRVGNENLDLGHIVAMRMHGSHSLPTPLRISMDVQVDGGEVMRNLTFQNVSPVPDITVPVVDIVEKAKVVFLLSEFVVSDAPDALAGAPAALLNFFSLKRRAIKVIATLIDDPDFSKLFAKQKITKKLLELADKFETDEGVADLEFKSVALQSIPVPPLSRADAARRSSASDKKSALPPAQAAKVQSLVVMGFTAEKSEYALKKTNWNVAAAVDWVLKYPNFVLPNLAATKSGAATAAGRNDGKDSKDKPGDALELQASNKIKQKLLSMVGYPLLICKSRLKSSKNALDEAVLHCIQHSFPPRDKKKGFAVSTGAFEAQPVAATKNPTHHILDHTKQKMRFDESADGKASDQKGAGAEDETPLDPKLFITKKLSGTSNMAVAFSDASVMKLSRAQYLQERIKVERGLASAYAREAASKFQAAIGILQDQSTEIERMLKDNSILKHLRIHAGEDDEFTRQFPKILREEAAAVDQDAKTATPLTFAISANLIYCVLMLLQPYVENGATDNSKGLAVKPLAAARQALKHFNKVVLWFQRHGQSLPKVWLERAFSGLLVNAVLELVNATASRARKDAMALFNELAAATAGQVQVHVSQGKAAVFVKALTVMKTKSRNQMYTPAFQSLLELVVAINTLASPMIRLNLFRRSPKWLQSTFEVVQCIEGIIAVQSSNSVDGKGGDAKVSSNMKSKIRMYEKVVDRVGQRHFRSAMQSFKTCNETRFTRKADIELIDLVNTAYIKRNDGKDVPRSLLNMGRGKAAKCEEMTRLGITNAERGYRYEFLLELNHLVEQVLPFINLAAALGESRLTDRIREVRELLFWSTKAKLWETALSKTALGTGKPSIKLSFLKAAAFADQKKIDWTAKQTVFGQMFQRLAHEHPRFFRRKPKQRAWTTIQVGLNSHDAGGPYREAIEKLATEAQSGVLPLFEPCPNARMHVGKNIDMFVPRSMRNLRPGQRKMTIDLYEFLGKLMGLAIRTEQYMAVSFPALVWKPIVMDQVRMDDVRAVDKGVWQDIESLTKAEDEAKGDAKKFNAAMAARKFEGAISNGTVVELVKHGKRIQVTWQNRSKYIDSYVDLRINEFKTQCEAMRRGLATVVPYQIMSLFTWADIRDQVSGRVNIDVALLKSMTKYAGKEKKGSWINANSKHIRIFWDMMENRMNNKERSEVIFFVWGRSRLPVNKKGFERKFTIMANAKSQRKPNAYLPVAHTCFFQLELPEYSTVDIMYERFTKACAFCKVIDGDNTSTARRAAGMR